MSTTRTERVFVPGLRSRWHMMHQRFVLGSRLASKSMNLMRGKAGGVKVTCIEAYGEFLPLRLHHQLEFGGINCQRLTPAPCRLSSGRSASGEGRPEEPP